MATIRVKRAAPKSAGGRPSQARALAIGEQILDIATELFLTQGYGATSIEAVARQAGISKRTFYHRFSDKAELFGAMVHRLVERMQPPEPAPLFTGTPLRESLCRLARLMLGAALSPQALALHRVITAEAMRFPELAAALDKEGARKQALTYIAQLLEKEAFAGRIAKVNFHFAAEQFMTMVIAAPQRRALGIGIPMTAEELDVWAKQAVDLFLDGCWVRY